MARKEETLAELEARDRAEQERYAKQARCDHYNCQPTRWYWSGTVEQMTCADWRSDE